METTDNKKAAGFILKFSGFPAKNYNIFRYRQGRDTSCGSGKDYQKKVSAWDLADFLTIWSQDVRVTVRG